MSMKHSFGAWKERVPIEIQKHVEKQLIEMKLHADPDGETSRLSVVCYFLVNYIRREVEDRVC